MIRSVFTCVKTMYFRQAFVGLLLLCLWASGCASQQDVALLQRQIWEVRRDLENSKAQVAELEQGMQENFAQWNSRLEADRQPLRRNQAAVSAQLDRIELELGRLQGQMEESEAMTGRQGERIGGLQEKQMTSMLEMQKSLDDLERGLKLVANYVGLKELEAELGKRSKVQTATSVTKQPAEQQPPSSAKELYGNAFQLFQAEKYSEARVEFAGYLKRYPKTELADNAQFWLGECYYAEKNYREAITAYEKTIKEYPKSDKVSSALLKQGMAFQALGDDTAAKILFKKLVKQHPESEQAEMARKKLADLE